LAGPKGKNWNETGRETQRINLKKVFFLKEEPDAQRKMSKD